MGVRNPGDLMIMYGSTMFLIQVLDDVSCSPGTVDYRWCRAEDPPADRRYVHGPAA